MQYALPGAYRMQSNALPASDVRSTVFAFRLRRLHRDRAVAPPPAGICACGVEYRDGSCQCDSRHREPAEAAMKTPPERYAGQQSGDPGPPRSLFEVMERLCDSRNLRFRALYDSSAATLLENMVYAVLFALVYWLVSALVR